MATKADLEKQIVTLKEKLKEKAGELKEALAVKKGDLGDRPYRAIGLFQDEKTYKIVRIDYNPENNASEVISLLDASRVPDAAHMAKWNLEEIINEEVIARLEENYA